MSDEQTEPLNAFSEPYLEAVHELDDPATAREADTSGPFSLIEEGMLALYHAWRAPRRGTRRWRSSIGGRGRCCPGDLAGVRPEQLVPLAGPIGRPGLWPGRGWAARGKSPQLRSWGDRRRPHRGLPGADAAEPGVAGGSRRTDGAEARRAHPRRPGARGQVASGPLLGQTVPVRGSPGPLMGRSGPLVGPSRYSRRQSSEPLRQSARLGECAGPFQGRSAGELEEGSPRQGAPGEGLGGGDGLLGRRDEERGGGCTVLIAAAAASLGSSLWRTA
jgi:hypothetical protein